MVSFVISAFRFPCLARLVDIASFAVRMIPTAGIGSMPRTGEPMLSMGASVLSRTDLMTGRHGELRPCVRVVCVPYEVVASTFAAPLRGKH